MMFCALSEAKGMDIKMSTRTDRLKDSVVIKTHRVVQRGLLEETGDIGKPFREEMEVKLCLDRAKLLTEGYRQNEHDPLVIKRAKALNHVLANMKLFILPDELIVGNYASTPNGVCHYPELQWRGGWRKLFAPQTARTKTCSAKMHKYWLTRAIHGMERSFCCRNQRNSSFTTGFLSGAGFGK